MRAASALIAALVLTACQVNVEGAPCSTPGQTTDCPDGQACGNDRKCSERAAGCGSAWCLVGTAQCVSGNALETCVASVDPVCGSWQSQACDANTTCTAASSTSAVCQCDANAGTEFAADPSSGSLTSAPVNPTGLPTPPQCRFKQLGDALATAAARGGTTTVQVYGSANPIVFQGETFPLVVPPSVTVSGATGVETIVRGVGSSGPMVTLQGTLQGLHLANVSMTGNGVEMSCAASGAPVLRDVVVSSGTQQLANGVTVTGSCGTMLTLERVDVSGASSRALDIAVPAGTVVAVSGSAFHGSEVGIHATGGKLTFGPDSVTPSLATQVTDNVGDGVVFDGSTPIDVTLTGVVVARNGGTGLYVNAVPAATSKFAMSSSDVYSNGTGSPETYGSVIRRAGGILFTQSSFNAFQFTGNRIFGNGGGQGADDLAFYSSWTWPLSGASSCATPNTFGCTGGGASASGADVSVAGGGTVSAIYSLWGSIPPAINGSVSWSPDCSGITTVTAPACP